MPRTTEALEAGAMMACVAVSSRVCAGMLGNSLVEAAFARHAPGTPLFSLDTVQWTAPGSFAERLGPALPPTDLAAMLEQLLRRARAATPGGRVLLLSGYMASAGQVTALADAVRAARHPGLLWIADPVMGDNGRVYVSREVVEATTSRTAREADLLLPNETEARLLAGRDAAEPVPVEKLLLYREGPPRLVKSIRCAADGTPDATGGFLGVFRAGAAGRALAWEPWLRGALSGAGDLFAGMLAAELSRRGAPDAIEDAAALAVRRTWQGLERVANGTSRDLREAVWRADLNA